MLISTFALACVVALNAPAHSDYFVIQVVDQETRRGVPLVEIRTVNDLVYYTDNHGVVAFHEPGFMDREVFFYVSSHGYEFPADGFGFRGKRLLTEPNTTAVLEIHRKNIAERLYRVTGGGREAESQLAGTAPPNPSRLLNAQVVGSDSVQAIPFRGRLRWFWGDTLRASYPLGNFHVPGATSPLPADADLEPRLGVDLTYFVDQEGFAKSTCEMPGEGLTWVDGLTVVDDGTQGQRMFASYLKVRPPLDVYQHGIAEWNVEKEQFEPRTIFPNQAAFYPNGHSFQQNVSDQPYVYFARPFPLVRVPAIASAVQDLSQYEAFTCLKAGSTADHPQVDRDAAGRVRYGWRAGTAPHTAELQEKLVRANQLETTEIAWRFRDVETGQPIRIHHGSLNWNAWRKRWIMVASEIGGSSHLGEVWFAESASPEGPWSYCRKIVTHHRQSFYNPRHHAFFDEDRGRKIYFEGTYTNAFSGNEERTPRYNYNQIMYGLDLEDERLVLPVPVYRSAQDSDRPFTTAAASDDPTFAHIEFFAGDRPFPGSIALGWTDEGRLTNDNARGRILCHVAAAKQGSTILVPLYQHTNEGGRVRYIAGESRIDGYQRDEKPLGYVWPVE